MKKNKEKNKNKTNKIMRRNDEEESNNIKQ